MEPKLPTLSYLQLTKHVLKRIKPYAFRFWLGTIIRLSADGVFLYTTYTLAESIALLGTYTAQGGSLDRFWKLSIIWAITQTYSVSGRQLAKYLGYWVSERVNLDVQTDSVHKLTDLSIGWHEKENTGSKLKRIHKGGEGYKRLIRIWIDNALEIAVNFIGIITIVAFTDKITAGIMALFLISYYLISIPLNRRAVESASKVNQLEEDYSSLAYEITNNIRSVKTMGMFQELFSRLKTSEFTTFSAIRERVKRFRFKGWVQTIWSHIFRVLATLVIVYSIINKHYDISFFLLFNFYFGGLRMSVDELSEISQDITIARYDISRLQSMVASEPLLTAGTTSFPKNWKKIHINNVSFSYGNHVVLKNISFTINRGEKIGIVGLSGAGKSTLFKLLLKQHDTFTGDIFFDDISIKSIDKTSFARHVATVLQETEVFNFSLKDNITLANALEANNAPLLTKTMKIAHVSDFIQKLTNKENTMIGEKGVRLSGGEKQRLGIARAIFKQPDILLLDEATSHLDLESEEKIKDSLDHFFKSVTAIVIAHRLTTIQAMDTIILLENGKLLESGSFKELHKKRGRFFTLWEKQNLTV